MRRNTLLGFLCGATFVCLVAAGPEILTLMAWQEQVNGRLDKLEAAVAILKRSKPQAAPPQRPPARLPKATARSLIQVQLSNKRFQASDWQDGVFEDAIWWDAEYTPSQMLRKTTRAVKGVLEFADLFGEVEFRLKVIITEGMRAGRSIRKEGSGFEYNQFLDSHKWMRATAFEDMKITFRVDSIIYADGTTQQFSD